MYCRNCGKEVHEKAVACPACGVPPLAEKKFCPNCAEATQPAQALCVKCGASLVAAASSDKNKMIAGLLGILLGALGIHKFYLGYTKEAVITLVVTLVVGTITCGVGASVMGIVGLIEGIMYLMKTDEDFVQTYVNGHKGWF